MPESNAPYPYRNLSRQQREIRPSLRSPTQIISLEQQQPSFSTTGQKTQKQVGKTEKNSAM